MNDNINMDKTIAGLMNALSNNWLLARKVESVVKRPLLLVFGDIYVWILLFLNNAIIKTKVNLSQAWDNLKLVRWPLLCVKIALKANQSVLL
jgi:hypothetical protein